MGCCFVRQKPEDEEHLELSEGAVNDAVTCKCGPKGNSVNVVKSSTANTHHVSGNGIMIGSCPLDGDTATWEVKLLKAAADVKIGIKRFNKKKPSSLEGGLDDSADADSPSWCLKDVELKEGDVIGVYWDQTDLPMLSFSLNGKLLSDCSVTRVRPANDVYPAVSVRGDGACEVIFDGSLFQYPPISSKFKMIICSTSLI